MYRTALRTSSRTLASPSFSLRAAPRRFASSHSDVAPADRHRSWKSSLARWGLAAGGIWYYTTSDVFADTPAFNSTRLPISDIEDENLPTVDAVAASRKTRRSSASPTELSVPSTSSLPSSTQAVAATEATPLEAGGSESLEELDEEANQQGAYNEETGEINWDCPCLGGMAHGPCGPEFREAFSCFIYSKDEPKGIDCIDKFKGMQDCFRAHPDIYGAELTDDEDDQDQDQDQNQDQLTAATAGAATSATPQDSPSDPTSTSHSNSNVSSPPSEFQSDPAKHPHAPMPVAMHHDEPHSDSIPTAAFSATTEETSVGAPPGATRGEDEKAKTKRAKAAAEQVKKDYGGKEADQAQQGKGHRSESDLVTGDKKGSKMSDDKSR